MNVVVFTSIHRMVTTGCDNNSNERDGRQGFDTVQRDVDIDVVTKTFVLQCGFFVALDLCFTTCIQIINGSRGHLGLTRREVMMIFRKTNNPSQIASATLFVTFSFYNVDEQKKLSLGFIESSFDPYENNCSRK